MDLHLALQRGRKGGNDPRLREGANKLRHVGSPGPILQGQFWRALRNPVKTWSAALPQLRPGSQITLSWSEKHGPRSRPPCPLSRAPPRRHHLLAPRRAAGWPHAQDCVSCRLGSQPGDAALPSAPATPVTPQQRTWGRQTLRRRVGGRQGGGESVHPAEGGPHLGPEPAWLCAPAAARPGESARPSCRRPLPRNWTRRRAQEAPMAPGEAGPAKPHGAGVRRCGRCQGPIQVQGPEVAGRRDGGRGQRKPGSRGSSARSGRGAAPTWGTRRPSVGICVGAAESPGSGATDTAGGAGRGKEEGPALGLVPRPPGTHHPDSPGQGWGEAVLSPGAS